MRLKKEPNKKYTDLCIYVDAHVSDIAESGKHPEIENEVWNNLWLIIKALAIKKRMFQKYDDYDGYAFFGSVRIYNALKKNYINQGKVVRGRFIKPIKSCLNYIKALLYPMKVEYQNATYQTVLSEEFVNKKFNTALYTQKLKAHAQAQQNGVSKTYLINVLEAAPIFLDEILAKSPFSKNSPDYNKLKISILLTSINSLKAKGKLEWCPNSTALWHLPKTLLDYIQVLQREFYTKLQEELTDCISIGAVSDQILDRVISMPNDERFNNED